MVEREEVRLRLAEMSGGEAWRRVAAERTAPASWATTRTGRVASRVCGGWTQHGGHLAPRHQGQGEGRVEHRPLAGQQGGEGEGGAPGDSRSGGGEGGEGEEEGGGESLGQQEAHLAAHLHPLTRVHRGNGGTSARPVGHRSGGEVADRIPTMGFWQPELNLS